MPPTAAQNSHDLFLRRVVWWLAGTLVYLQLLSVLKLLGNVWTTSLPLAFALVMFAVFWRRSRSAWFARPTSLDLALAVALVSIVTYLRILEPPRGYDVLAYHLPYTVEWMRNGWAIPFYSAFSQPIGYYPGNLEVLALPFLALTHSAYLINAINIFSYLLMAGVVWALAPRLGVRPSLAVLAITVLMFTSRVTSQMLGNAYNDLFLAAALITAWYFAEEYVRTHRIQDVWLSGLLIGIAIGTKYAGLVYAFVFFVVFCWRARQFKAIFIFCFAALLPCVYWYARTYAVTDNPFYPQGLNLFGHQILEGVKYMRDDQTLITHLGGPQFMVQFLRALVLYGHVLLIPMLIGFPFRRFLRPELRSYWIAGVICFALYLLMPLSAESYNHVILNYRYALPFQWFIMIAGTLAALSAWPLPNISQWFERHSFAMSRSLAVLVFLVFLIGGYALYQRGYVSRLPQSNPKLGRGWAFLETLPPSRIAYAGWQFSGALYGSHFQHTVDYVNVNGQNGENFHDYHGQDHRANQDFSAWRSNLDAERIDLIWLFKRTPTIEREWVQAHPQLFPTIYEDKGVRIVRVSGTGSDESFNVASN